jgi:hypothetical protein
MKKTTIELPENLILQAKRTALDRGITLRDLVESGLTREIRDPSPVRSSPLAQLQSLPADIWQGMSADAYVEKLRQDWE